MCMHACEGGGVRTNIACGRRKELGEREFCIPSPVTTPGFTVAGRFGKVFVAVADMLTTCLCGWVGGWGLGCRCRFSPRHFTRVEVVSVIRVVSVESMRSRGTQQRRWNS